MNTSLTAAAVTLALAFSAQAIPPLPSVQPGFYRIEPTHTRVLFSVSHFGFTTYYGEFVGASGTLELDPTNLAASRLDVSVPIAGISTPSAALNGQLKGPDWFNAAAFPIMSFHSTLITSTGPNTADVDGDLTLHGVTRPVTFKARFTSAGIDSLDRADMAGFEVRGRIRRSDFGVTKYVPLVGDEVRLIISAGFERAGASSVTGPK
ncbi:MAG: YceI family protein [Caulobacteraceae bacterium]